LQIAEELRAACQALAEGAFLLEFLTTGSALGRSVSLDLGVIESDNVR
jgi:hypothetical protein